MTLICSTLYQLPNHSPHQSARGLMWFEPKYFFTTGTVNIWRLIDGQIQSRWLQVSLPTD